MNRFHHLIPLALALLLAACSGRPASTPFEPIRPDPTATPTVQTVVSPTSVVPDSVSLLTYTHPSGRFSIQHPANWDVVDQPGGVLLVDPGDQAGIAVQFQDAGQVYSAEELNGFLVTYVARNFAGEGSGFTAIDQHRLPGGGEAALFSTVDPARGRVVNQVRVEQHQTVVFITLLNAVEAQWKLSQAKLESLADTLTVLDSSPLATPTPAEAEPVWTLIGSTGNRFAFLYPSNWTVVRQDESTVQVELPDLSLKFEGSMTTPAPAGSSPVEQASQAAQQFVDQLMAEYGEVQSLPAQEFPLGQTTGATIDFLYTTAEGEEMAGSVITAVQEDTVYRVVFTAPAKYYQAALEFFNPMYKSFKILSPEDLPTR